MGYASKFTIDNEEAIVKDPNAVSTIANQGLSEQQKANARSNIGAGDSDFSGSYNDLTDKPTIPIVNNATLTIQKNGTNVQTFTANASSNVTANITMDKTDVGLGNVGNFKAVSTVANQGLTDTEKSNARTNIGAGTSSFSGSYNDLTDKPTIPTVNNATLTIQKNGTNVQTFTANQGTNATANITVPTKVSELTNDSGYTTNTGTVTQVKVGTTAYNPSSGIVSLPAYPTVNNATLTIQKNGSNVQTFTANQGTNATANITVPTKVSELTNDSGYTTNTGTVTQVKVGTTAYNPSSGIVSLPAYPTVNNATLTIQKNGSNVQTFTANQGTNVTANITVPTNADITALIISDDGNKIAPSETTNRASRTYYQGDYFIYNGTLYIATATISAGGTITPNSNCTTSEPLTLNCVIYTGTLNSTYFQSGSLTAYYKAGICVINITNVNVKTAIGSYQTVKLGDLPNGLHLHGRIEFAIGSTTGKVYKGAVLQNSNEIDLITYNYTIPADDWLFGSATLIRGNVT